jgi:hypothetical protein
VSLGLQGTDTSLACSALLAGTTVTGKIDVNTGTTTATINTADGQVGVRLCSRQRAVFASNNFVVAWS